MKPEDSSVASTEKIVEQGTPTNHIPSPAGENGGLFHPGLLALAAAVIAGLATFGLGEVFYGWFPPEGVPQMLGGAAVTTPTVETTIVADTRNSALSFALLGGCLGLALGLAGGMARRSRRAALTAGLIGLIGGAVLGAVLPLVLVGPYIRLQHFRNSDDLLYPLGMHSLLWGTLGAVGGLAFGIGLGRGHLLRSLVFALVGACVGTAIYEVIGAAIDPLALTSDPISKSWWTRLMARLLVTVGVGMAICLSLPSARRVARSVEPSPSGPTAKPS